MQSSCKLHAGEQDTHPHTHKLKLTKHLARVLFHGLLEHKPEKRSRKSLDPEWIKVNLELNHCAVMFVRTLKRK